MFVPSSEFPITLTLVLFLGDIPAKVRPGLALDLP